MPAAQLQGTIKFGDPADWDLDATRFPKSGTYRIAGRLGDPAAQGGGAAGSGSGSGGDAPSWVDISALVVAIGFAIPGLISSAYVLRKYFGSSRVQERFIKQNIRKALMEESPFEVTSKGIITRVGGRPLGDITSDIAEFVPQYKAFIGNAGNVGKAFQSDLWELANRLEIYNGLQGVERATQAAKELREEIGLISARLNERLKRDVETGDNDSDNVLL